MSLVQQGTKTARNRNRKITGSKTQFTVPPSAMIIWNNDAHVLNNTCPAWGNVVAGLK